jgi:hypothetical protein
LLTFIEMHGFSDDWKSLRLGDEALFALQAAILNAPKGGNVIAGTGGLRKLRFAPPEWKAGKRGAVRVCYVYLEPFGIVLLVVAYGKNRKDDLTGREKRVIRGLIERQTQEFARRRRFDGNGRSRSDGE